MPSESNAKITLEPVPTSLADLPLPTNPATLVLDPRVAAAIYASKAETTRRVYGAAWRQWAAWCVESGNETLPPDPEAVASHLAARAEAGRSIVSLRLTVAALQFVQDTVQSGSGSRVRLSADPLVAATLRGLARKTADRTVGQAKPLDPEAVATIRGSLKEDTRPRAIRDLALISLLACTGLRRSEVVRMVWQDLHLQTDGTGRLIIHRSKTDQTGEGAVIAVTKGAMDDLLRWYETQDPPDNAQPVFDVCKRQISRIVAQRAAAAGLGEGYSGHSGRVGLALTMTRNQAPPAAVQRQGRWKTTRMIGRYTRNESAEEALRYL